MDQSPYVDMPFKKCDWNAVTFSLRLRIAQGEIDRGNATEQQIISLSEIIDHHVNEIAILRSSMYSGFVFITHVARGEIIRKQINSLAILSGIIGSNRNNYEGLLDSFIQYMLDNDYFVHELQLDRQYPNQDVSYQHEAAAEYFRVACENNEDVDLTVDTNDYKRLQSLVYMYSPDSFDFEGMIKGTGQQCMYILLGLMALGDKKRPNKNLCYLPTTMFINKSIKSHKTVNKFLIRMASLGIITSTVDKSDLENIHEDASSRTARTYRIDFAKLMEFFNSLELAQTNFSPDEIAGMVDAGLSCGFQGYSGLGRTAFSDIVVRNPNNKLNKIFVSMGLDIETATMTEIVDAMVIIAKKVVFQIHKKAGAESSNKKQKKLGKPFTLLGRLMYDRGNIKVSQTYYYRELARAAVGKVKEVIAHLCNKASRYTYVKNLTIIPESYKQQNLQFA